ncbi:Cellulose-binding domain protein [Enhygromyxa salina]|uniref:Cellulose-binding domain protein n=2 Tax=Enhygromyxa salina TaxID=215803 RepID=A0A0C2A2S3_9BACT|nr:Cellulose-binding domain protein [Enhygromyxa salina]
MNMRELLPILVGLVVGATTTAGCQQPTADPDGQAEDESSTDTEGDGDGDGDGDEELTACEANIEPGPAPIRRLTRVEYNNTIYQLFGDNSQPANAFPADEVAGSFDNQAAALVVSPLLAEQYEIAAEQLASTHAPALMDQLPACGGVAPDPDSCTADAEAFITSFGKRAYRRPLTDDEVSTYIDLFITGTGLGETSYEPVVGVEVILQGMLQSPHFLYRVEFGAAELVAGGEDVVALTSYEIASRLSYLLWNTMPDASLFEAADADELQTAAQIEAQARRMMDTPRAREAVKNFHRQWLGLGRIEPQIAANGKNLEIYPDYSDDLLSLWRRETEAFIDDAVFEQGANVEVLFTANYTMMNKPLADFYGVTGPTTDAFERVDLDPSKYAGFLTHAGLLALYAKPDRSSPIHRGKFVREVLLCQSPPPPPDIVPEAPSVDESQTTRDQFLQHSADALCAGCHRLMDPLGFGFEHFDGIGRYRETEWGLAIDASGELIETDNDGPYDGAVELAAKLAASEQVKNCVATQWFQFGYGRTKTPEDSCSVEEIQADFAAANYDIKELIIALTLTDAFRYRHVITAEESP